MIPDAAVATAARVIALSSRRYTPSDWDDRPDDWPFKDEYREIARAALEAAAPHMRFELQCLSLIDEMD